MTMTTPITYQLDFSRYNQHITDVTLHFVADADSPVVWLPSWLAGSYLMREFARNITAIYYRVDDSGVQDAIRADKISKNEWQLNNVKAGDSVTVTYEVYCYDLSVRTAYVDNRRIFGNFSTLTVAVAGQEGSNISVELLLPLSFCLDESSAKPMPKQQSVKIACGLPVDETQTNDARLYRMQAANYDELIDYPFEIAPQTQFDFEVVDSNNQTFNHRFFISGVHHTNQTRLAKDVQQICQTYVNWLEDTPFDNYTFMTFASGNDYGGLEHINSTALVTPRDDLPKHNEPTEPSDSYQRYLGLCSHEYFHAWWVKTVRPDVMLNVDLRKEAYTPLLWVFEGFTSYIDDFMLQASGVASKSSYLKLLTAQINRYNQTAGRMLQTVAESSFDAWIKLYRADENTGNAGISYYNKGALVALCLDLVMLEQTKGKYRLFDVVKRFYALAKQNDNNRFGMTNDNLAQVMAEFISTEVWQSFYQQYVIGLDELPINELLANNGITVNNSKQMDNLQAWGMVFTESTNSNGNSNTNGITINKINRDSVASEAGLSAKDVIVAIDGIRASKKQLYKMAGLQAQQTSDAIPVVCHAFRRDELMTFNVPAVTVSGQSALPNLGKVILSVADNQLANNWLDGLK